MPEDGQRTAPDNSKPSPPEAHDDQGQAVVKSLPVAPAQPDASSHTEPDEFDDFGLPIRKPPRRTYTEELESGNEDENENNNDDNLRERPSHMPDESTTSQNGTSHSPVPVKLEVSSGEQEAHAEGWAHGRNNEHDTQSGTIVKEPIGQKMDAKTSPTQHDGKPIEADSKQHINEAAEPDQSQHSRNPIEADRSQHETIKELTEAELRPQDEAQSAVIASISDAPQQAGPSEWSHQHVTTKANDEKGTDVNPDDEWQAMPAYATHTIYDDWGKVVAREIAELDEEEAAYGHLGGAGKGYTKVQLDDDVQSATSMDEDTAYLFKPDAVLDAVADEDDEGRDILSQMQATKDLLTEGQRIAYVGLVRLSMTTMTKDLERLEKTRATKKFLETAVEAMQMWTQKMMVRLYSHMELDAAEQIMIEQLAQHGVEPADLTPTLMQNARVKNPVPQDSSLNASTASLSPKPTNDAVSPQLSTDLPPSSVPQQSATPPSSVPPTPGLPPPPYQEENPPDYLTVRDPAELANSKSIDLDLRWTVLCDLFLVLIADSVYDARSRTLLELVGSALSVPWIDICRFEKRVTDALEMQEAADKENWNEDDHMVQRKKRSRNRRLVMMGLATVGGGLVIGLSAGLLAPVIGAGLAAGFTTIGVAGTSGFLAGAGGAAIITSTGVLTGGTIAVRATGRRTGSVKTFEYRPLYNNKRVNLIVTVAGWMTGKVDDVRLPFSTVDPIMGDMYSVWWEPEMLRSMGDTINILATEALTQGLQQVLGSTILIALMSAMQLPLVLTKLSYLIDNPWAVSQARADMAGLILADSLIDRNLGVRPITLVGFSIGARLIFSCLKELADRGAFGLIQNVYLFGTPCVVKKDEYLKAKAVVSGRFVNGYANNDWILGYLFRATSGGIMKVAGLAPIDIPGIENHDVTSLVPGHMAYRTAMPKLLREVGWMVDSDEFAEIEDPDPENHDQRQRELINEIEEARRQLEKKPEKKGFKALFSRNKKNAEKKPWEMYEAKAESSEAAAANGTSGTPHGAVLFDIDAIRAEVADLAAQGIEVKEIKSTLPPMKLNLDAPPLLRQTKSYSGLSDNSRPDSPSSSTFSASRAVSSSTAKPATTTNMYDYDEHDPYDPPNISMTFDTPEQRPSVSTSSPFATAETTTSTNASLRSLQSPPLSPLPSATFQRPPLISSNTTPTPTSNSSSNRRAEPSHNAWADDDNIDEFGHEKEVNMTFE